MRNGNGPVDLDYNLLLVKRPNFCDYSEIWRKTQNAFNQVLSYNHLPDCDSSTSVLTTQEDQFTEGNPTKFRIDVAIIVKNKDGSYNRLRHEKGRYPSLDRYYWIKARDSHHVFDKADHIRQRGKWDDVREEYKRLKNLYLSRNDHDHPSFVCYAEAVNNVYNSIRQNKQRKH